MEAEIGDSRKQTRQRRLLATAMVLGTGVHAAVLVFRLPWIHSMEGWFWAFRSTPLSQPLWLLVPVIVLAWVGSRHFDDLGSQGAKVVSLMVAGFFIQLAFALAEGRGLNSLRDRMVRTGHARFARVAVRQDDLLETARTYQRRYHRKGLGRNPLTTKPPGQLLVYMLTDRISRPFHHFLPATTPYGRLTLASSVLWPAMTYLVLLVLVPLGSLVRDGPTAINAAKLMILLPNLTLITLHLDQCLYPTLAVACVVPFLLSIRRRSAAWALLSGALYYLSLYVSFALLAVLPLLLLCSLSAIGDRRRRLLAHAWGSFAGGFLLFDLLARFLLNYHLLSSLKFCLAGHQAWKEIDWTLGTSTYYGALNLIEWALWLGLPVTILFLLSVTHSLGQPRLWRADLDRALPAAVLAVTLLLAFFGRTAGEVARLWLLLTPFLCLAAASQLARAGADDQRKLYFLTASLQLVTLLLIKIHQDFY